MPTANVFRLREYKLSYDMVDTRLPPELAIKGELVCYQQVAGMLASVTAGSPKEQFWCFHLDVQNRVIGSHCVSVGTLTQTMGQPRDVFREAIVSNAFYIIVGHNHPGGDPWPSPEDIAATAVLVKAGETVDIPVFDHIIVANQPFQFYSFRQHGRIGGCP